MFSKKYVKHAGSATMIKCTSDVLQTEVVMVKRDIVINKGEFIMGRGNDVVRNL